MMKALVKKLYRAGLSIAAAESCTGGLIAKEITDVPGSSAVFGLGVVSYSNTAKEAVLGVKAETLEKYGAVSEQTAREMASAVRAAAGADIAVSTTGVAGPASAEGKPVGTVYIGISTAEKCYASAFVFSGNRANIRMLAAKMALNMALLEISAAPNIRPYPQKGSFTAKRGG